MATKMSVALTSKRAVAAADGGHGRPAFIERTSTSRPSSPIMSDAAAAAALAQVTLGSGSTSISSSLGSSSISTWQPHNIGPFSESIPSLASISSHSPGSSPSYPPLPEPAFRPSPAMLPPMSLPMQHPHAVGYMAVPMHNYPAHYSGAYQRLPFPPMSMQPPIGPPPFGYLPMQQPGSQPFPPPQNQHYPTPMYQKPPPQPPKQPQYHQQQHHPSAPVPIGYSGPYDPRGLPPTRVAWTMPKTDER